MTLNLPDRTSEAADWGTCCHQIAERCLRDGGDADRFIGATEKGKEHSFEVDEEMADCAQVYIDHVRSLGGELQIEQRFSLAKLNPPFDAGGTGDAVVYLPEEKRLVVVDLKGGRGVVVEAASNPQLRTYGLGALLSNPSLSVNSVTVTIVQPRAPHPSGRIRSETIDVVDLHDWTVDLLAAMRRAREAMDAKADLAPAAWAAAFLRPGDHCGSSFCKAAGFCPALEQAALDAAGVWFDAVDQPHTSNVPDLTDPDARAARLDMLDMIEEWVKQVRAHEHHMAEGGDAATGYGLVAKKGREKWNDGAEDQVKLACEMAGLAATKFINPGKLMTPKQVRKALGKKAEMVDGMSNTPNTGTNLVRLDGSIRQEIVAPIASFFQSENQS